jgi:Kef-type K+ transport system membrane component KefB
MFAVLAPAGGFFHAAPEPPATPEQHAEEGAQAVEDGGGHHEPVMPILIALTVILLGARFGGEIFARMGQPAVLGELIAGVFIGNLDYMLGTDLFHAVLTGPARDLLPIFAGLGAVVLLFEVGLETSLDQMLKVGGSAGLVAAVGVVVPWLLGYAVSAMLIPEGGFQAHLFVGAILTATSVGITARVFKDMGRLETREARVILGAAVLDDILGLIILAVVSGMVTSGAVSFGAVLRIVVVSILFLGTAVLLGGRLAGFISNWFGTFRVPGMKLITALLICFGLSYLAGVIGLATIVGAFAAGLILEETTFRKFSKDRPLHELLDPFSSFFVPIFFVLMGIAVRLEAFADPKAIGLAAAITVAAIIGKQVCGLVVRGPGLDKVSIGLGMIPRGEVGLIFASIGRALGVVDDTLYAACVIMVIVTTFVAPVALQFRLRRAGATAGSPDSD